MASEIIVISTSLNPGSQSRILAQHAFEYLNKKQKSEIFDLKDYPLPLCDGDAAYGDSNVVALTEKIDAAKCVLVGVPIYNFNVSASAKNLIELTGKAWENKIVGFLCAAGGKHSYMSVMPIANSLMLDFRCLIIPRFVYAEHGAIEGTEVKDKKIVERIHELIDFAIKLTNTK